MRGPDYVDATKVTGKDLIIQLLECCEENLRKDLSRAAGGSLTNKTRDDVLAAIKTLAQLYIRKTSWLPDPHYITCTKIAMRLSVHLVLEYVDKPVSVNLSSPVPTVIGRSTTQRKSSKMSYHVTLKTMAFKLISAIKNVVMIGFWGNRPSHEVVPSDGETVRDWTKHDETLRSCPQAVEPNSSQSHR